MPSHIQRARRAPDGTFIRATHVNETVSHGDTVLGPDTAEGGVDWSLTTEATPQEVYDRLLWGTYGPARDEPLQWVVLSDRPEAHLKAILRHRHGGPLARAVVWAALHPGDPDPLRRIRRVLEHL